MRKQLLFVLLTSALVFAQNAPQSTTAVEPATSADVPPDAAVITIQGLCPDKPAGTDPKSPECQSVVTRNEFERVVQTLGPNMPPSARQTLANDYARILVIANEARKRGLEKTKHYQDMLEFMKLQLLGQELMRNLQEKAKPSAAEVEKYYSDNTQSYEQLAVKRLFIPRNHPETAAADGKTSSAPQPLTDAQLVAQGETLRQQLVAGGDFEKLQKEVYEAAGFKTPPPPTSIPNWPHDAVPSTQQQLFQLKPKEFSKVMIEPAGAYIFQIVEIKRTPFEQVRTQIESTLTNQRMRATMEGIMGSVKPELNSAYFRMIGTEAGNVTPSTMPPAANRPARPTTAPAPQGSPAPK